VVIVDASSFVAGLGGTTPGEGTGFYGQLNVAGGVSLGSNVTLTLSALGGYLPNVGDTFIIINNDGADAVVGTFSGLAEGAASGPFTISYIGGDGNDVVLTLATAVTGFSDLAIVAGSADANVSRTVAGGLIVNYAPTDANASIGVDNIIADMNAGRNVTIDIIGIRLFG
jgi:hypothetical protein